MAQIMELSDDNSRPLKLLEAYIQSGHLNFLIGSGASLPAINVAGSIEAVINALIGEKKETEADLKCVEFLETIDGVHATMVAPPAQVTTTLGGYRAFLDALDRLLFTRKNLLLPRQANVFTTNYDMFIEQAANSLPTLILNDGFDRSPTVTSGFPFAWERYFDRTYRSGASYGRQTEVPTINLIKLHGSLSWRKVDEIIVFDTKAIPKLSAGDKANPAKVAEFLRQHFLILPNVRKFHSALMDRIYYDMLRIFANSMDRGNSVLFAFGFSFADEHILDITRRALRNPTAQLIIFSYDHQSAQTYSTLFAKHRNVLVVSPANGTNIDFARMTSMLTAALPKMDGADVA